MAEVKSSSTGHPQASAELAVIGVQKCRASFQHSYGCSADLVVPSRLRQRTGSGYVTSLSRCVAVNGSIARERVIKGRYGTQALDSSQ
jgi:hypothetical protein